MSPKFKQPLILVLVLALAMSAVTGGTIAWFTDEVTSANNVIKSGSLDLELEYLDDDDTWQKVTEQKEPLFNYQLWEPGYTQLRQLKLTNAGDLAFKFELNILPNEEAKAGETNLADVIEVYYGMSETAPANLAEVKAGTLAGTLSALAVDEDGAAHGVLLPKGETSTTYPVETIPMWIALHMKEEAGNEYQNLSAGNGFGLNLLATQFTYEADSFDHTYDSEAEYPLSGPILFNGSVYQKLEDAVAAIKDAPAGRAIILNRPAVIGSTLEIPKGVTLVGNGYTVSRAPGFTGTIFTVKENASLTLEDIKVDGGAVWTGDVDETLQRGTTNSGVTAAGNLIAAEENSQIILNNGAVLQNNVGVYAVNLGTRIGATLTMNGGQIINNQSGSGAIWGGGNITINEGSKISGNSSTGLAGVIRMVSSCNLTMNGGEISHNKAVSDGGVIWGYGASTYSFNGGEIAFNESAGTGGAIYTGNYSVINIGGDFELHDNKAANSGAIRLTDHTSLTMTGGKVYNNTQNGESNVFNTWNNSISITGGEIKDNFSYVGGLGLTIGAADISGVISYDMSTNHNTAYLTKDFSGFSFKVDETNANFANFNFKPADGYTYTAGDETKLACLNDGYSTCWDAATGTFRLQAK